MKKKTDKKVRGTPRLGLRGIIKNVGHELKASKNPPTEGAFVQCLLSHMMASDWFTVEDGRVYSPDFPKKGWSRRYDDVGTFFKEVVGPDPDKLGWTKWFKPWDYTKKADYDKWYAINAPVYGPRMADWPKDKRPEQLSQFDFAMKFDGKARANRFTIYPVLIDLLKRGFAENKIPEGGTKNDMLWRIRMADYANFNDIAKKIPDKMEE